jgi:hypothetical protein
MGTNKAANGKGDPKRLWLWKFIKIDDSPSHARALRQFAERREQP